MSWLAAQKIWGPDHENLIEMFWQWLGKMRSARLPSSIVFFDPAFPEFEQMFLDSMLSWSDQWPHRPYVIYIGGHDAIRQALYLFKIGMAHSESGRMASTAELVDLLFQNVIPAFEFTQAGIAFFPGLYRDNVRGVTQEKLNQILLDRITRDKATILASPSPWREVRHLFPDFVSQAYRKFLEDYDGQIRQTKQERQRAFRATKPFRFADRAKAIEKARQAAEKRA